MPLACSPKNSDHGTSRLRAMIPEACPLLLGSLADHASVLSVEPVFPPGPPPLAPVDPEISQDAVGPTVLRFDEIAANGLVTRP